MNERTVRYTNANTRFKYVHYHKPYHWREEALAIRRVFSLVNVITNTKFSNCTLVFKTGAVRQQNMQSKHQNRFQSNLSSAKQ